MTMIQRPDGSTSMSMGGTGMFNMYMPQLQPNGMRMNMNGKMLFGRFMLDGS